MILLNVFVFATCCQCLYNNIFTVYLLILFFKTFLKFLKTAGCIIDKHFFILKNCMLLFFLRDKKIIVFKNWIFLKQISWVHCYSFNIVFHRMAYALLTCFEKSKIKECVVPTHWIEEKTMWWPLYSARQQALDKRPLDKKWPSYAILEIRFYDGKKILKYNIL